MHTVAAEFRGGSARAFGQKRADSPALRDGSDGSENSFGLAEAEAELLCLRQQSFFAAFHRPGQCASCADRVESIKVTELCRLNHRVGIANAAERAEREKSFIFHPLLGTIEGFEQSLAANRARGAAMFSAEIIFGQRFSGQRFSIVEGGLLKVACG